MKKRATTLVSAFALGCLTLVSSTGFAQSSEITEDTLISLAGAPSLGEKSAKVTMVEFSDYQCPLSSLHFNWTMRQLVEEYVKTGKVRYVFRDFPLESLHPLALKAAEAAHCSGDQGRYWEIHDRFFRNQAALEVHVLPSHARMLGLDLPEFQQCLESGKNTAKVRESAAAGRRAGVRGTPWFFLGLTGPNETKLRPLTSIEGAQPYEVFREAIDRLFSRPPDSGGSVSGPPDRVSPGGP